MLGGGGGGAVVVDDMLETLVHRPGNGRARHLVKHARLKTLKT